MDILLIIVGAVCLVVGLLGCILPMLPGPPLSYVGILLLHFTSKVDFSPTMLLVWLVVVVVVVGAVYLLSSGAPAMGYVGKEVSPMTLKLTDTVLNLTYILCALTVLAIIYGAIRNAILNK